MSPVVTLDETLVYDDTALKETALKEIEVLERAWHGPDTTAERAASRINNAQLTVTRNSSNDFQDRQVYLYVDGELWGKVKYGRPMSREIPPGRHKIRAFNTLFSHTIEIDAVPGEHVKLRCTNGMPTVGWLMMIFLHVTALRVRLERDV